MELRISFNEDEVNYDTYRPTYPDALFEDVVAYSQVGAGSRLIEIGIGTGQATLPFLRLGCDVTGIELGDRLSAFVGEKYSGYSNFRVINTDFMLYPAEDNACDLIYSATAFHWLPQEEAYAKIMRSLKKGGTLALFWNHPFPNREDDPSNMVNRRIYDKYRPSNKKQIEFCEADCAVRIHQLQQYGFKKVESKLYRRVRTLTTEAYIHLLNTYSDHRALDAGIKESFEAEMRQAIDDIGGSINIYDTIDLYLAEKP